MTLPELLGTITLYQNAARRFAAGCRRAAAEANVVPALRDELLRLADSADAIVASNSFTGVMLTALDELGQAVRSGRSIVQHQATDLI